ncbi:MAG: hypothetical protein JSV21_05220 [Nitrospirota bacterium]|nr:MAG: hypothetical protein JSV21_05220 [Nitrospirota bacterium]
MSLIKGIAERKKLSKLIGSLMESSFYLEMELRERLMLVKVMMSEI